MFRIGKKKTLCIYKVSPCKKSGFLVNQDSSVKVKVKIKAEGHPNLEEIFREWVKMKMDNP